MSAQLPSPLPRGDCPVCHRNVALRKGGIVREHRTEVGAAGDPRRLQIGDVLEPVVCSGSGAVVGGRSL